MTQFCFVKTHISQKDVNRGGGFPQSNLRGKFTGVCETVFSIENLDVEVEIANDNGKRKTKDTSIPSISSG